MPTTKTLTETVIVAYLKSPMNITILDVASWAKAFESDFNVPQQTPASAPFSLDALPGQGFVAMASGTELPRLILRSAKHPFVVQLQSDRFGFSWARQKGIGEEDDYIGFEKLKERWSQHLATFAHWFSSTFRTDPKFRATEITYTNALPLLREDGSARRLSEVFRFVSPGSRPVNAFSATWAELLSPDPQAPRVSAVTGVGLHPLTGQNAVFYNFTGVGLVDDSAGDLGVLRMLDSLHERIHEMHTSAIGEGL